MTKVFLTRKMILAAVALAAVAALGLAVYAIARADTTVSSNFEGLTLGTMDGQDGWSATGSVGSSCGNPGLPYDVAVSSSFGVSGFGDQSLRISNAVMSGCFGDQTFSKPVADEAGETGADNAGFPAGTRQNHFEASFDIRPMQLSQQPGLSISVSPDRGDGSRMSYLRFEDHSTSDTYAVDTNATSSVHSAGSNYTDGIHVFFDDVTDPSHVVNTDTFNETEIATLDRAHTHTIKFVMDFVDGPDNDVVKIYIDGNLAWTGTSWEDYYRYDTESNPSAPSDYTRTVRTLLFRTGSNACHGLCNPNLLGLGYLIDNVSLTSSTVSATPVTVTIAKYVDDAHATAGNANSASFPMHASWSNAGFADGSGDFSLSTVGFNNPNPYEATTADMSNGANYSVSEDTSGGTVGADCSSGKPFALNGYSVGDDELGAAAAATSSSVDLTGIATSKWVIVHNVTCPGTLIVKKVLINDNGGSAATSTFSFKVNGGSSIFFDGSGENDLAVAAGFFSVVEDAAAGYTTTYANSANANADCNNLDIANGQTVTCTITNNDNPPPPPEPPVSACATPTVAPSGFTLQNGTAGNDNITIAPFTMFVGKGGNDVVHGPADGNYIVCTGSGNDSITLGNGDFTIDAGNGINTIQTGNGNGTILSGPAGDHIITGNGVQTINADGGNNIIQTGDGDKTVTTGSANDQITTGAGNDVINAGGGVNVVSSGAGDDTITTGSGNDTIDGGPGTDTCNAGGGINTVVNCEL